MTERKRKTFTASIKAKVGLEAIRGVKTTNEIAPDYGVQVGPWKKAIAEQAGGLFEGQRGRKKAADSRDPERLYGEIGRLKMELDWLKKSPD